MASWLRDFVMDRQRYNIMIRKLLILVLGVLLGEGIAQAQSKLNVIATTEDLASIAKAKNLTVPTSLDAKHQKMVDDLSKKSGADFDAAYTKGMAKDHTKAVQLFTRESHAQDSEFAGFAKKTLPTLEEHKKMADKLVTEVRTAAAGNSSSPAHR